MKVNLYPQWDNKSPDKQDRRTRNVFTTDLSKSRNTGQGENKEITMPSYKTLWRDFQFILSVTEDIKEIPIYNVVGINYTISKQIIT